MLKLYIKKGVKFINLLGGDRLINLLKKPFNAMKRLQFKLGMSNFQEQTYNNFRNEIESNTPYVLKTSHYGRGFGKTSVLLKLSHDTGVPFLISLNFNKRYVERLKQQHGFYKANIITKDDLFLHSYGSSMKVIIDEPSTTGFINNYPDVTFYGFVYDSSDEMGFMKEGKV